MKRSKTLVFAFAVHAVLGWLCATIQAREFYLGPERLPVLAAKADQILLVRCVSTERGVSDMRLSFVVDEDLLGLRQVTRLELGLNPRHMGFALLSPGLPAIVFLKRDRDGRLGLLESSRGVVRLEGRNQGAQDGVRSFLRAFRDPDPAGRERGLRGFVFEELVQARAGSYLRQEAALLLLDDVRTVPGFALTDAEVNTVRNEIQRGAFQNDLVPLVLVLEQLGSPDVPRAAARVLRETDAITHDRMLRLFPIVKKYPEVQADLTELAVEETDPVKLASILHHFSELAPVDQSRVYRSIWTRNRGSRAVLRAEIPAVNPPRVANSILSGLEALKP